MERVKRLVLFLRTIISPILITIVGFILSLVLATTVINGITYLLSMFDIEIVSIVQIYLYILAPVTAIASAIWLRSSFIEYGLKVTLRKAANWLGIIVFFGCLFHLSIFQAILALCVLTITLRLFNFGLDKVFKIDDKKEDIAQH